MGLIIMPGYYEWEGWRYTRVSRVLSIVSPRYLSKWRERVGGPVADAIMELAGEEGTVVHNAILAKDLTNPLVVAVEKWKQTFLWYIKGESLVYLSDTFGIGGEIDLHAIYRGDTQPTIFDYKTGHRSPLDPLQLAFYQILLDDNSVPSSGRNVLLYLESKPNRAIVKPVEVKDVKKHKSVALNLLRVFEHFEGPTKTPIQTNKRRSP